jgi:hypothetical protein
VRQKVLRHPFGFAPEGGKFHMGMVTGSAAAGALLQQADIQASELLVRHALGDHGEIEMSERAANKSAIITGYGRIVSIYRIGKYAEEIVVMTEADRSITTLFVPEEW